MGGGTWVRLTGLLFADFRRANGELAQPGELAARLQRQLHREGGRVIGLDTPYDGIVTEGGGWLLQCRFGGGGDLAGHVDGFLAFETSYSWNPEKNIMQTTNYTGKLRRPGPPCDRVASGCAPHA